MWVRGLISNKYGKTAFLLVGPCFIRPSDLTPIHPAPIHLKAFDLLAPVAPALIFAGAYVGLFRTIMLQNLMEQPGVAQGVAMLQQYFRTEKLIFASAFMLIIVMCYVLACITFSFHWIMCVMFGQSKTDRKSASLKFFVVKSSTTFAYFAIFSCLVGLIMSSTMSFDPQSAVAGLVELIDSHIFYVIPCGVVVYVLIKVCRENGRLAMREIYTDEATYHNVQSIFALTLVTAFVVLAFLF